MIQFSDRAVIGQVKDTKEGYLIATARVARTGVQNYLASEIGDIAIAAGFKPDAIVRVYRHEDQVFHADTLSSLTRVPVTLNHPPELVDAENWSKYAVGEVGDRFSQDGDWIVVNPMIKDAAAKTASRTTHREISMGYTANIVAARDGVDADFEMSDINMNHLALVEKGRAGSEARIGDSANWGASPITVEDKKMTVELKTVILGDKAVKVEASDADTVTAILKDHKTAIDAKDAEIGALTVKLADAESKILTDAQISERVAAKVKSDTERAAVVAKLGDKAKDWSDSQIEGAYLALDAAPAKVDDTARKALSNLKPIDDADAKIAEAQRKFLHPEAK